MKPLLPLCLLLAAAASCAFAQDSSDHSLNDGAVHFRAPATWSAVMEKKEGNPQAIAFQVPDPSAQGSEDSATVTVKTRQLADASAFAATVQEEFERAKAHGIEECGHEEAPGGNAGPEGGPTKSRGICTLF